MRSDAVVPTRSDVEVRCAPQAKVIAASRGPRRCTSRSGCLCTVFVVRRVACPARPTASQSGRHPAQRSAGRCREASCCGGGHVAQLPGVARCARAGRPDIRLPGPRLLALPRTSPSRAAALCLSLGCVHHSAAVGPMGCCVLQHDAVRRVAPADVAEQGHRCSRRWRWRDGLTWIRQCAECSLRLSAAAAATARWSSATMPALCLARGCFVPTGSLSSRFAA